MRSVGKFMLNHLTIRFNSDIIKLKFSSVNSEQKLNLNWSIKIAYIISLFINMFIIDANKKRTPNINRNNSNMRIIKVVKKPIRNMHLFTNSVEKIKNIWNKRFSINSEIIKSDFSVTHDLTEGNKANKKFKALTKKQRKKLRMAKANRVIYPSNRLFVKTGAVSRKMPIFFFFAGAHKYVHDGYSWDKVQFSKFSVGFKIGILSIKTRALSPVNFWNKGQTKPISMVQQTTYKVRNTKVKRKK